MVNLLPMKNSTYFPFLVGLVAIIVVTGAVALGWRLWNGDSSLLRNVTVQHEQITPNADGDTDVTRLKYELSRNAVVSIYFENEAGDRFYFREDKDRGAGEYEVLFSGVVDGYTLPDELIQGDVLSRLLRDGSYTWTVEAVDANGLVEMQQGQLAIVDADPNLPERREGEREKKKGTPTAEGIEERWLIQLEKKKEEERRGGGRKKEGGEGNNSNTERDKPASAEGRQ